MSLPSPEYWAQRALEREERSARKGESLTRQVTRMYERAAKDLESDVGRIISTFRRRGNLSEKETAELLSRDITAAERKRLMERIGQIKDPEFRRKMLAVINAPAYKWRIKRAQLLKDSAEVTCARLADQEIRADREALAKVLQEGYERAIYDAQAGTGIGFRFAGLSLENARALVDGKPIQTLETGIDVGVYFSSEPAGAVKESIDRVWSGKHFSERVWDNTHALAKEAKDILQSGLLSGRSVPVMTAQLRAKMECKKYEAARLIRTEINDIHNQAELLSYRQMGVKRYVYLATLDKRTCSVCGALDMKTFPVDEAQTGVNFPPIHPNDRCTTTAQVDEKLLEDLKRRARDRDGKNILVPRNTTWEQWKKEFAEGLQKDEEIIR